MQTTGEGCVGSGGFGTGHDGMDKLRRSWHEQRAVWTTETRDVRAAEAATPKHWASIERRRKRQTAHRDKDNGRSSKRTRRALEARVADRNVGARVDAREQPDYGLRGRDDTDEYYAEHEHDTIWGDTVVASRREPCASPPVKKLDFEAVALHLRASSPREPATPAPGSVLKAAAETPAPPPVVRQPALGAQLEPASPPVVKQLDFEAIELEAPVANPRAVPQEELLAVLDFFELEERAFGVESSLARGKALVAVSKNFDPVYAAAYAEQVTEAKYLLKSMRLWQALKRIQACWRGAIDRKWIKMLKIRQGLRGLFLELCRQSDAVEPLESPSEPPVVPSVPASVSALHRPCPARGSTLTPLHCPTPQRQCATQRHACAAVPRVLVSLRDTPAPVPA